MPVTRAALALVLLACGGSASAVSKSELEDRIQQLERKLDSRSLIDLLEQVKALQRDVQQLRGDMEVQTYNLEGLQKRQRELYLDIDRRMHRLETGGAQMQPPGAGPAAGAAFGPAEEPGSAYGPAGEPGAAYGPAGEPGAAYGPAGEPGAAYGPASEPGAAYGPAGLPPGPPPASPAMPAAPGVAAPPPAPAVLNPAAERQDYDKALEVLKEGRYAEAAAAFRDFLGKYPQSAYADNAQYWRGEVFYVTREFPVALAEFEKVVTQHPESSKVSDAKLKMGYIHYELEDWAKARDLLNQVVQQYPGTTSARLAQERLDRMNSEGR